MPKGFSGYADDSRPATGTDQAKGGSKSGRVSFAGEMDSRPNQGDQGTHTKAKTGTKTGATYEGKG